MKYRVMLAHENDSIHATVPGMPRCHATSEARNSVLELIRDDILSTLRKSEIIEIDIPDVSEDAVNGETDWRSCGYGAFKDDPLWGELFDEIERNRDLGITRGAED